MSIIPTQTYSNPNFSGSSQAVNSPQVNLPYIWDGALNDAEGAWRPTTTGDFLTATIENAQVNVNLNEDEDSVNIYTNENQSVRVESTDLDIRNLDKDEDSVNIYTNENQSVRVESTDLDIRNLNFGTDSVEAVQLTHDNLRANANIQINNVDVSSSNTVPVSNHAPVVSYSQTLTVDGSSTARDFHSGYVAPITKHGYIFKLVGTSASTSITIKVLISSDNTTFAPIEEITTSWDASNVNDSVRVLSYFGEFNFKYAKVQVEMTDCTCHIQETHTC